MWIMFHGLSKLVSHPPPRGRANPNSSISYHRQRPSQLHGIVCEVAQIGPTWFVARLVFKKWKPKDMLYDEIGLCVC